jgi:DNA-binding transcriptional LysR family regulator
MLNLIELQVFLAAAETENFSEAGRRLNLSQPAVSMQIKSLELHLGHKLFHRAGRNIALTEAGATLITLARNLVNHAIHVEETMLSLQGQVIGVLRLGCSTTSGKYVLPRLVSQMLERHPQVQVVCHVTTRKNALQMLLEGDVQIAISSLCEPYKDIEYRPFLLDPVVLVVRPEHRWAVQGGLIQPQDLLEEKFIMREEGAGTRLALREALSWHGLSLDQLTTVMILGNSEAIRMSVQEGIGIAFVSSMVAAESIESGSLVQIDIEGMEIHHPVYFAHHTGRPASSAQTALWELAFSPESDDLRHLPETHSMSSAIAR